jgi:hypothetical protein
LFGILVKGSRLQHFPLKVLLSRVLYSTGLTLTLILTAWEFKKPFLKMKLSPGWLTQNIFKKIKNASQKILTIFFVSEVFLKNVIFSMLLTKI